MPITDQIRNVIPFLMSSSSDAGIHFRKNRRLSRHSGIIRQTSRGVLQQVPSAFWRRRPIQAWTYLNPEPINYITSGDVNLS